MPRFSRWFVLAATFGFAQPGAAQLWLADHVTYLQTPPLFLRAADGRVESVDGNLRWLLGRRLSLQLERVTIKQALTEITRQTGLFLAYSDDVLPPDTRISLHTDGITLAGALDDVLSDTGLNVVFSPNGQATLVKRPRGAIQVGMVGGYVTDSTTGRPIVGAVVTITEKDTSSTGAGRPTPTATIVTNDSGWYQVEIPPGEYAIRVRAVGYAPSGRAFAFAENERLVLSFALRMGMTRLAEVVVTATVPKRRLDIPNDITTIQADSIAATQPIRSVTDLLETRVPGLEVEHTSGAPGDPSRLRLRGASSFLETNDPIVIVNGVRVYSDQSSDRAGNLTSLSSGVGAFAAPSPLDQIDPNSIETIEVLKGPAAATLYGQDAANGVIVITTKRGRAGPPRWTASVERGMTEMPGAYPLGYFRWGHGIADNTPRFCTLQQQGCVTDSIVRFQLLSNPQYTLLGQGERSAVTVGVSGGTPQLTYAVSGDVSDETGLIQLPMVAAARYTAAHGGVAPPDWMGRPDEYRRWGATSRLQAQIGEKAVVSLTAMLQRGTQRRSTLEGQLPLLMNTYYDAASGQYYRPDNGGTLTTDDQVVSDFYMRVQDVATTFTNAVNVTWQPRPWLQASTDAGLQLITRDDESLLPYGADAGRRDSIGSLAVGRGTSLVRTVNARATATAPLPGGFRLQTAVGANYNSTSTSDFAINGTGLVPGTSSVSQAGQFGFPVQNALDLTSFGWYVVPSISRKEFTLSLGLRLDGGSTFGAHVSLPAFPQIGTTYVISDKSWFPFKRVFDVLRLRIVYGAAGTWPGPADRLRLFSQRSQLVDSQSVTTASLTTLGNTQLRPERSTETEGGFDADILDNRLSVSLSLYHKMRYDALMSVPVPPSVGGSSVFTILKNIGVVRNTGLALTLGTHLVRTALLDWTTDVGVGRNHNLVLSVGPGIPPNLGNNAQRLVAGYPLFGFWARPILGYADRNHDGVIEPGEVLVGDSAVFMGSAEPNYEAALHSSVALFGRALTLGVSFQYQNGVTQLNLVTVTGQSVSQALNDPHTSFGAQAAAVAPTDYGQIETVSVLRLTGLTVSYRVPTSVAHGIGAEAVAVTLQGANVGVWTKYRGKDPNVNAFATGNAIADTGQLPIPRTWQLRMSVSY